MFDAYDWGWTAMVFDIGNLIPEFTTLAVNLNNEVKSCYKL